MKIIASAFLEEATLVGPPTKLFAGPPFRGPFSSFSFETRREVTL